MYFYFTCLNLRSSTAEIKTMDQRVTLQMVSVPFSIKQTQYVTFRQIWREEDGNFADYIKVWTFMTNYDSDQKLTVNPEELLLKWKQGVLLIKYHSL